LILGNIVGVPELLVVWDIWDRMILGNIVEVLGLLLV
jgi:hypothetical protein